MKNIKICERCRISIDIDEEKYVLLGTYEKKKTLGEAYFHFQCWILHFEEKARQKAEAVVQGMSAKIMPMAKEMIGRFVN